MANKIPLKRRVRPFEFETQNLMFEILHVLPVQTKKGGCQYNIRPFSFLPMNILAYFDRYLFRFYFLNLW